MLPDFLIVGTMKGGTTSLARYLGEHPEICMHPKKELHFFDSEVNFKKGIKYYENQFKGLQTKKSCKVIGEATPAYMYFPWVTERIYTYLPDVKLIFILRHPVERAYSHYWFALFNGVESVYPFEKAIKLEKKRLRFKDEFHLRRYSYLDRGKYIIQIKRFLQYFPRENMLFLVTKELRKNPEITMKKVFEFLEVDTSFTSPTWNKKRYNVGHSPKHWELHSLITKATSHPSKAGMATRRLYLLFRKRRPFNGVLFRKGYPPMEEETRKKLLKFFRPYNRKLEKFLDMPLHWWYV